MNQKHVIRLFPLLGAVCLLAACAARPVAPPVAADDDPALAACERLYTAVESAVATAGAEDGSGGAVPGAPWLRSDRWLAAQGEAADHDAWLQALREREVHARLSEYVNLGHREREALREQTGEGDVISTLLECGERLANATEHDDAARAQLVSAAQIPDEYITWHRWAGVYPLTRFGILAGVRVWQNRVPENFDNHVHGEPAPVRYVPAATTQTDVRRATEALAAAPRDGLGRLEPDAMAAELLFAVHAPVIEAEADEPWNRIGTPFWESAGRPNVLTGAPRVYTYLDHARYNGAALPRLNYTFWFSSRPKAHVLDILGGRLDGMTVRITLSEQGMPVHLETMHNCGCYQQHYLLGEAEARADHGYAERPLVLDGPALPGEGERWVVRLQDRSHYVAAIGSSDDVNTGREYALAPYRDLTRLRGPDGGYQSLFRPDGMVDGTSRDERALFWVSGVPDAGAMRQHGRHATAFVGRRQFDDADMLERIIRLP
ncbi:hypothetical protein J2T57_003222 [Natronocella acetinitrilica]|uniref:Uncharacterized protein n=1 Tax=Natronocella acetinitrilica TaxID=414046 RepID=A0AAE3G7X5_9GAMM|nr:hypothetical protein [Natronocella acetinitrilica]MCP1676063.1 hypothetical protein [Natronocella acetinitrilica]